MYLISFVPTLPIALFSAIFFRNRWVMLAWILPVVADLVHYFTFTWSGLFFFTAIALLFCVALTKVVTRHAENWKTFLSAAVMSMFVFWILSDFGVWFIGSCLTDGSAATYTPDFAGLLSCWKAGFSFFMRWLLINVPSGMILMAFALRFRPKTQEKHSIVSAR